MSITSDARDPYELIFQTNPSVYLRSQNSVIIISFCEKLVQATGIMKYHGDG